MATSKQTQANRANARRSTGPRTAAGKAKSSLNAIKHGLRAQTTVLPGENIADFHALVGDFEEQFQPATALEWTLLRQLADAEWRMRRVPHIEAGVLAKKLHESREHYETHPDQLPGDPDLEEAFLVGAMAASDAAGSDILSKLSRYEARLSHRYFRALDHLRRAQERRQNSVPPAAEAATGSENNQRNPIPVLAGTVAHAAHHKPSTLQNSPSGDSEGIKSGQSNPISPTMVCPAKRYGPLPAKIGRSPIRPYSQEWGTHLLPRGTRATPRFCRSLQATLSCTGRMRYYSIFVSLLVARISQTAAVGGAFEGNKLVPNPCG
jgi:hypothetical protein